MFRGDLDAVALVDAFPPVELHEVKQVVGQGVGRGVKGAVPAIQYMQAIFLMIRDVLLEIGAEAGQVAGDGGQAECGAFEWRIAPRFLGARENREMAAALKVVVVHAEERVVGGHKVGMIHDLHRVARLVE